MKPKRLPRPSAYLWARCEGWAKIGVCQSLKERLGIGDWGFRFNGLEENADSLGRSRGKRRRDLVNSACQSEKHA